MVADKSLLVNGDFVVWLMLKVLESNKSLNKNRLCIKLCSITC